MKQKAELKLAYEFARHINERHHIWPDVSIKTISKDLQVRQEKVRKMFALLEKYELARMIGIFDIEKLGSLPVLITMRPRSIVNLASIRQDLRSVTEASRILVIADPSPVTLVVGYCKPDHVNQLAEKLRIVGKGRFGLPEISIASKIFVENNALHNIEPSKHIYVDDTDLLLINQLRLNARVTLKDLAKLARITEPSVHARLKRLKRDKVLLGYRCAISDNRGIKPFRLGLICDIRADPYKIDQILTSLKQSGSLRTAYEFYSRNNLWCELYLNKVAGVHKILDISFRKFGIEQINLYPILYQEWINFPTEARDILSAWQHH